MRFNPFIVPIWKYQLDFDFELVSKKCLNFQNKDAGRKLSNEGGYQSSDFNLFDEFPELIFCLADPLNEVEKDLETRLDVRNSWVNINNYGDFNYPHIHSGSTVSSVLYIKTEEKSGKIVFKNPAKTELFPVNPEHSMFYSNYWINPTQGMFLVFPSYLEHMVEPNRSKSERISIATNLFGYKNK